jgi:hypothetical protein
MNGKSQMTELQETITERIINFNKEKDWHLSKSMIDYILWVRELYNKKLN